MLVGSQREKSFSLKNDGSIPANAIITYKPSPCFSIKDDITDINILPGRLCIVSILFSPQKIQRYGFDLTIGVSNNPKCALSFNCNGEGFYDDIVFEGDLQPTEDSDISFANRPVGKLSELEFFVHNVSAHDIRFVFPVHHDFSFLPRVGHIRAGSRKEVKLSFISEKPVV